MTLVIIVIAVVVLVVLAAVAGLLRARSHRHRVVRREEAGELRGEAAVGAPAVQAQQERAADLEREATRAREKADLLEERAREQRLVADRAAAEQEEAVREADRLDPDLDHRSEDYVPDTDAPHEHAEAAAAAMPDGEVREQVQPRPTDPEDPDFRRG